MSWFRRTPKHVHEWNLWEPINIRLIGDFGSTIVVSGQARRCQTCGYQQNRQVKS